MRLKGSAERRRKMRFDMARDMRYKLLENDRIVASGVGTTENLSSGGVAFLSDGSLPSGAYVELSISWPMLLDNACPMRLIVFGRVLRGSDGSKVCTIEKWEFRTQARHLEMKVPLRIDAKLQRWAEYRRDVTIRAQSAAATA